MDPITASTTVAGGIALASQVFQGLKSTASGINDASKFLSTSSLIDITKAARVEPICLVDVDISNYENLTLVMQSIESIFSGYYLQAVALMGTVGNVNILKRLAPLNPNRATFESHAISLTMAVESYKYRLPTSKNTPIISLEANDIKSEIFLNDKGSDSTKILTEAANLSVGKLYDVTLVEGGQKATIKVAIRLMSNVLATSVLVNLFTFKDKFDTDLKERFHAWRAGRLSFFRDLIFCSDLIKKHRETLIKDKSGVYSQIVNRENNNLRAGLWSKNPSLATASNLAVISRNSANLIEEKLSAKFNNFKARSQIFDSTNLMIIAIVDPSWDRVQFYHRGIEESTNVSIKDMKSSNKNNGPDTNDILKAYLAGSAPQI